MLQIDRRASVSIQEQLLEQLRYLIASGTYRVDDRLPSTRSLAGQLGISFHTVRKAYQQLEREGYLSARPGSGFTVCKRPTPTKAERMEQGAAVVQEMLQRLVALGLDEDEMEYLFQEQSELLLAGRAAHKVLCVGAFLELAELCAEQIGSHLQRDVQAVALAQVAQHQDADYVLAPFPLLQEVMQRLPRADCGGFAYSFESASLERVARLLPHQTAALVTRTREAIPPFMAEVRAATGFGGHVMAASTEERADHLDHLIAHSDVVLYTPGARRRTLARLGDKPGFELVPLVTRPSLELIRQRVPA